MSIIFNADEIFGIAVNIEKNGAGFYKKAAGVLDDAEMKKVLMDLAEMELDHEKTFLSLKQQILGKAKESFTYDPDNEVHLYLEAFAKGHVFDINKDPKEMLKGNESPREILKMAIGLEKDSIAFYVGIKQMVPLDLGKDQVDKIIVQEMGHIRLLSNKLDELG